MSRFVSKDSNLECLYCEEPVVPLAKDGSFNLAQLHQAAEGHYTCSTDKMDREAVNR